MAQDKINLSRRSFVKAASILGGAAALYGCSRNDDTTVIYGDLDPEGDLKPPVIDEEIFVGSVPHNCGGSCIIKAHVKDGVIKRFTTDELPEYNLEDPIPGDQVQERACPRCRSQKSWIYSSNRITYPLIQTGARGDISTFKRVSWQEAGAYYKAKVEKIRNTWGPAAFYKLYGTGAGGTMGTSNMLTYAGSGQVSAHQDYSFPSWEHTLSIMSDFGYPPDASSQQDALNSDVLVVWSHNLGETFWQPQITWYLKQIQELGVKVVVIDPRYSQTAVAACDEFISPVQGTDTAFIMAVIHEMLTTHRDKLMALYGVADDNLLRQSVGKYLYGFFDTNPSDDASGTNESYVSKFMTGTAKTDYETNFKSIYTVGAGMSLSAYVMGGSKVDPCNLGASIYPDIIHYNARTYEIDGEFDPLLGKDNFCYGQAEKTPAWAESITGVPAQTITDFAEMLLTKKVSCWAGGGFQRNSEGEQNVWAWEVLMTLCLAFGEPGRTHGWTTYKGSAPRASGRSWSSGVSSGAFNDLVPDEFKQGYLQNYSGGRYTTLQDTSKLTISNSNSRYGLGSISVFTWLDAVEATNSSQIIENGENIYPSRWNLGQIKNLPAPIKMLYQEMGNILINQNGDSNHAVKVLTSTSQDAVDGSAVPNVNGVMMNPMGYKVEFICVLDCVMTPSARYADLVLPGTVGFERYQTQSQFWRGYDKLVFTQKAINPPGEAKWEPEIGGEIAKAFGVGDEYYNGYTPNENFGAVIFEEKFANNPGGNTFDWWKKNGMYKNTPNLIGVANKIALEAFRLNPGSKAPGGSVYGINGKCSLSTTSGRTEAYCAAMMENYEARLFNNVDSSVTLANGGKINTKSVPVGSSNETLGRFVYPIPMYIPLAEGRHASAIHPDPLGIDGEYPLSFCTWHIMYRSHSTFNSSPLLNELKYYKRGADGKPAFIKREITNANAALTNSPVDTATKAPLVWTEGVYETVWLNPATAAQYGDIKEGDVIYVESLRGIIKVSAHLSERIRPSYVLIGQGSWYNPVEENGKTVDIGGCANTLMSLQPSRIGQGMTLNSDCRVKIYKGTV